ncbi:helix-turn-helix domain-containing protein [Phenylobacterium sp.]|uniref:helix-turn-helix domain-containing protein n=1 Tax=Phenylobacterium sp. TaxID=1871053 RepID=UPI0035687C5A
MSGRPLRAGGELVVARLDDLAPSLEDLCALLRRITAEGVRLRLPDDRAPLSETETRLLVKGILLAADFQARLTAARLRDAVVGARESGRFRSGRPRKVDAEQVARLRAQGLGATAIARELGVARASIYRRLREIEAPETRRLKRQA